MIQLTEPQSQKLDAALWDMYQRNEQLLESGSTLPVILRGLPSTTEKLVGFVGAYGGKVRQTIPLLNAVAAWLPIGQIPRFAALDEVKSLELEQEFTIA